MFDLSNHDHEIEEVIMAEPNQLYSLFIQLRRKRIEDPTCEEPVKMF